MRQVSGRTIENTRWTRVVLVVRTGTARHRGKERQCLDLLIVARQFHERGNKGSFCKHSAGTTIRRWEEKSDQRRYDRRVDAEQTGNAEVPAAVIETLNRI
jgi:hypothetical protein